MRAVIIAGSTSDKEHVGKITANLDDLGVPWEDHVASAHKEPLKVLEIIATFKDRPGIVFITVAGRSNALSGFVAANSDKPVLACPPFKDKVDMLVNIHSTLQMPSKAPVLTVLDPSNCALAARRILQVGNQGG
ncbi:MAG: AIR carboxylase family protein [Candidatus Neomarinimicrobiota bacterium]